MSFEFFAKTKRILPSSSRGREICDILMNGYGIDSEQYNEELTIDDIAELASRGGKESLVLYLKNLDCFERTALYERIRRERHRLGCEKKHCACFKGWQFHHFFTTQRSGRSINPKRGNIARVEKMFKKDYPRDQRSLFGKEQVKLMIGTSLVFSRIPYYLFPLTLYGKTANGLSAGSKRFNKIIRPGIKRAKKAGRALRQPLFRVLNSAGNACFSVACFVVDIADRIHDYGLNNDFEYEVERAKLKHD